MPTSALPRVGGREQKKKTGWEKERKKDEMQSKGVEGLRVCGFARAVGCRLLPSSPACSALSVVGTRDPCVLQTPSRAGTSMAPAQSLGFGSSEAMGWGASIRPSGQCASNLHKVQTDLSRPTSGPSSGKQFSSSARSCGYSTLVGLGGATGCHWCRRCPGRRERLVSGRLESLDVCNTALTNRMYRAQNILSAD